MLPNGPLPEGMQFAAAIAAGVPIDAESRVEGDKVIVTMTTAFPVSAQMVDGKMLVFVRPERRETEADSKNKEREARRLRLFPDL